MSQCAQLNCSFDGLNDIPIQPNPDVAGIGVLIGFLVPAYLSLIIVVIDYLFLRPLPEVYKPGVDSSDSKERSVPPHNDFDSRFLRWISSFKKREKSKFWYPVLQSTMLSLCDQQLITGISILVAGFLQLCRGITIFHWHVIVYLAWLSSVVHLSALKVLFQKFRDSTLLRLCRIVLMIGLLGLLVAALIPSRHPQWDFLRGQPVACLYQAIAMPQFDDEFKRKTLDRLTTQTRSIEILSIMFLVTGYCSRMIKMWEYGSRHVERLYFAFEEAYSSFVDQLWKRKSIFTKSASVFCLSILVVVHSVTDYCLSGFWETLWIMFALTWGSKRLLEIYLDPWSIDGPDFSSLFSEEDTGRLSEERLWTFGQCVPVALLALPLLSFMEACYERWKDKTNEITDHLTDSSEYLIGVPAPTVVRGPSYHEAGDASDDDRLLDLVRRHENYPYYLCLIACISGAYALLAALLDPGWFTGVYASISAGPALYILLPVAILWARAMFLCLRVLNERRYQRLKHELLRILRINFKMPNFVSIGIKLLWEGMFVSLVFQPVLTNNYNWDLGS